MVKDDKSKALNGALKGLAVWFGKNSRILPWRSDPSVYRVWVSEIMLQQTTVKAVIPFYEKFLERFPTLESLASASLDDVLLYWAGLGYYSRARNLHRAAQTVSKNGYPADRAGWLELPGVGEYTAGAVLSIAMNKPEALLDANVKRVISRLKRFGAVSPEKKGFKNKYWDFSGDLVRTADALGIEPRVTNQALMELGALVCRVKEPGCDLCPLSGICLSCQKGDPEYNPPKSRVEKIHLRETVYSLMDDRGRVLLTNRGNRWRKGLWDFPGKLQPGQIAKNRKPSRSLKIRYTVTNHIIERRCLVFGKIPSKSGKAPSGYRWVDLKNPLVALGAPAKRLLSTLMNSGA